MIAAGALVERIGRAGAMGITVEGVKVEIEKLVAWKAGVVGKLTGGVATLLKAHKVDVVYGDASFVDARTVEVRTKEGTSRLEADAAVIATGSAPIAIPGFDFDEELVWSSTGALAPNRIPKHLVVIGAGYIGLELGSVWARLGSRVSVLEYLDRILPGMDAEIASEAKKALRAQGLEFQLSTRVSGARVADGRCVVEREGGAAIECDRVLLAVGRLPSTQGLGLDAAEVELDERGRIRVDETFATSAEGVYAIGDVIRGPMLAHKAEEEGIACVERLVTGWGHVDYDAIPGVVYTAPEVASVGRSEDELREASVPYRKGIFPFAANGRARALGLTQGKVKVLAHGETDRLLGVHVIGARAGDLIAEAAAAIAFGASSEDVARTPHAHPTLAEAFKEAALAAGGRAIHA
jgi:dihydrolipoamide dehydrogenase